MGPVHASSSRPSSSKPYDRLPHSPKPNAKPSHLGLPSQLSQTSRKGKRAWRKNIDVSAIEEALESAREEERITGGRVADKKDGELFVVDTIGDVEVAKRMRRAPKPLRSLAILSERSAIPSLSSRPTASSSGKTKISPAEKARLRRIARRNTITMDSTGLSSADVKKAGICQLRDAWTESVPATSKFGKEGMIKRPVKPPPTLAKHRENYLSSQVEAGRGTELPEAGVSYNPTAESHQRLLELAVEEEEERLRQETADEERIKALGEVVNARRTATALEREYADGMTVGPGEVDNASVVDEEEEERTVKPTRRKTQAERNKAIRLREASRLASLEARQKKTLRSISAVPALKSTLEKREKGLVEAERLAKLAKRERERLGLEGGEKVGKWRVGKGSVAVQLGEDLAETLRQVKPEGNLFKDQFLGLQKRALIEPRVPQLPKRRIRKVKEYEKHAYKRFT